MSLYEVSDIVRDQSFLARDLIRGGEPVSVSEKLATQSMRPWDVFAARIVKVGPRTEITGAALPMPREVGEDLCDCFADLREKMRPYIQGRQEEGAPELAPYAFDTEGLRQAASMFTTAWLEDALRRVLDPIRPALVNSDGDTIEFTTVRYPLKPGVDRKALVDGIAAIPGFHRAADGHWDWAGPPAAPAPDDTQEDVERLELLLPDGSVSLGTVEFEG